MQNGLIQWNFAKFSRILGLVACAFRVGRTIRDDKEMTYWILRLHWGVWKETGEWWVCRFAVTFNWDWCCLHRILSKMGSKTVTIWRQPQTCNCPYMFQKYTKLYIPVQTIIYAKKIAQWEESPFLFNEVTPVIMSSARFSCLFCTNQFSLTLTLTQQ